MLGLDFVKANREAVERAIRDKGVALDLDELLMLDTQVRALKTEADALRAERNAISAKFPRLPQEKRLNSGGRRKRLERALRRWRISLPARKLRSRR